MACTFLVVMPVSEHKAVLIGFHGTLADTHNFPECNNIFKRSKMDIITTRQLLQMVRHHKYHNEPTGNLEDMWVRMVVVSISGCFASVLGRMTSEAVMRRWSLMSEVWASTVQVDVCLFENSSDVRNGLDGPYPLEMLRKFLSCATSSFHFAAFVDL